MTDFDLSTQISEDPVAVDLVSSGIDVQYAQKMRAALENATLFNRQQQLLPKTVNAPEFI